jgi:NADH-quinone oxidoreductase subunit M
VTELRLPWLELAVLIPTVAAVWVGRQKDAESARRDSLIASSLALLCATAAWLDFGLLHATEAYYPWPSDGPGAGRDLFVIDQLSAPLLPLACLLYLLTHLATLKTKIQRFSFAWSLAAEATLLATFSCRQPWAVILLVAAGTIHPWIELRVRRRPQRVYVFHMAALIALLIAGQSLVALGDDRNPASLVGVTLLMAAVLLRSGVAPIHCWMTDLFEHATFGTALLFVTPMVGAYASVRLVLPIAPEWALRAIALLSIITAVYAAGMALVQQEVRRFFCYLFLSHSSLVLVGLELATPIGLTAALCVWLSVGLCLGGFGLTLRSIESRVGRLLLSEFHGLYEHAPMIAAFFLLTGLASIGFPGTVGFVGTELLVDGAVLASPLVGAAVVLATGLNSVAVLHAYFRVFNGARHRSSVNLRSRPAERVAILTLTVLILGGGLFPQPGVSSRYRAAVMLVEQRRILSKSTTEDREVAAGTVAFHERLSAP